METAEGIDPEKAKDIVGRQTDEGALGPSGCVKRGQVAKATWERVKKSYLQEGVTNIKKLAEMYGLAAPTLYQKIHRCGWRQELKKRYTAQEMQVIRAKAGHVVTEGVLTGDKPLAQVIAESGETVTRSLIETMGALLERVRAKAVVVATAETGEISRLIDATKDLYSMLDGLLKLGGGKTSAGPIDSGAVRVKLLMQVVEQADKAKAGIAAEIKVGEKKTDNFVDIPGSAR